MVVKQLVYYWSIELQPTLHLFTNFNGSIEAYSGSLPAFRQVLASKRSGCQSRLRRESQQYGKEFQTGLLESMIAVR